MSDLVPLPLTACRGLSLSETIAFAVELVAPGGASVLGDRGQPVRAALDRLGEGVATPALGRQILARLREAWHPNLHPEWTEHLQARERRHLFGVVEAPVVTAFEERWLIPMLRRPGGHVDPRHQEELAHGLVLEFDQLPLLPHDDLQRLMVRLGVRVGAAALAALGRRQLATLLQRLDGPMAAHFAASIRAGDTFGRDTLRLARAYLVALEEQRVALDVQLRDLGALMLATACAGRFRLALIPIARALPVITGQRMLESANHTFSRSSATGASLELPSATLHTLQAMAARGETLIAYHERELVASPGPE